jgi:hypothetical protein
VGGQSALGGEQRHEIKTAKRMKFPPIYDARFRRRNSEARPSLCWRRRPKITPSAKYRRPTVHAERLVARRSPERHQGSAKLRRLRRPLPIVKQLACAEQARAVTRNRHLTLLRLTEAGRSAPTLWPDSALRGFSAERGEAL